MSYVKIEEFVGKTFVAIEGMEKQSECITFRTETETFRMFHKPCCCEGVVVEDVCGDPSDLVGTPIVSAYSESHNNEESPTDQFPRPQYGDSYTWTFYRLETAKSVVTLRWLGESNGYYGEDVDIERVES